MSKSVITYACLALIFALSLFLHFYKINSAPNAVLVDEAALGYNAYSIDQTGKDEYGTPYPLVFKSFGDQKLPLYVYASAIPVKVFGLNPLAIRFVATTSMALLVLVAFLILKELEFDDFSSLVGAGITAASSWTLVLGRFGWESSLGLLIFSLAILSLIKSSRSDKFLYFFLSGLFLGIAWYSYIPYRIISIFVLLAALFIIKSKSAKNKLTLLIVFLIFLIPTIPLILSPAGSARFKQTTILTNVNNAMVVNDERLFCGKDKPNFLCSAVSNKPIEISYNVIKTGVRIFSLDYLFVSGESDANYANVGKFALFPIFLAPFYLLGLITVYIKFKKFKNKRETFILFSFFGICILPVLITRSPQRIQMSSLFPFFLIIIVLGYSTFISRFKHKGVNYLAIFLLSVFGLLNLFYFINIHSRKDYGNEEFMASVSHFLGSRYNQVNKIYVNSEYSNLISFYAFYNKVDPRMYQKSVQLGPPGDDGFQHSVVLGKISIYQDSYSKIACAAIDNKETDLYLTNENMYDLKKRPTLKPLYVGKNAEGLDIGYVYNVSDLITPKECIQIAKNSL